MRAVLITILVSIFAFSLFAPLFAGKIFFDGDTLTYDYPAFSLYKDQVDSSETPGFNSYYLAGYPTAISPVGSFIDPLNVKLISVFKNYTDAYHARFFISVLAGILFAFIFARLNSLTVSTSLFVAFSYITAQTLHSMSSGLINNGSIFLMPAILSVIYLANKARGFKENIGVISLGALILGYGCLAGFIQTVFYSVILGFVYVLYLSFKDRGFKQKFNFKLIYVFITIGLGSLLISLPRLLPTFIFKSLTTRSSGFGSVAPGGVSFSDLIYTVFPDGLVIPFISSQNPIGLYLGALSVVVIILGFIFIRKDSKFKFFSLVYIVSILLIFEPLGIIFLIQKLPVFSWFHTVKRLLLPASFFGVIASGYALDLFLANRFVVGKKLKTFFIALTSLPVISFLAITAVLKNSLFETSSGQEILLQKILKTLHKSPDLFLANKDHYLFVFAGAINKVKEVFSFSNVFIILSLISLPVISVIIFRLWDNKIQSGLARKLLISIAFINIFSVFAFYFPSYLPRNVLDSPSLGADTIKNLESDDFKYYVVNFLTGEAVYREINSKRDLSLEEGVILSKDLLVRNYNVISKVPRIDGYEPFETSRQAWFWDKILAPEKFNLLASGSFSDSLEKKKAEFLKLLPVLSSYNVKYIISGYEILDSRLSSVGTINRYDHSFFIYKNENFLSRVYVPEKVKIVSEWTDDLFDSIKTNPALAVLECQTCEEDEFNQLGSVKTVSYQNGDIYLEADIKTDFAWIVVNQSFVPGWKVLVDESESEIYQANYLMSAIKVAKGKHKIRMFFENPF